MPHIQSFPRTPECDSLVCIGRTSIQTKSQTPKAHGVKSPFKQLSTSSGRNPNIIVASNPIQETVKALEAQITPPNDEKSLKWRNRAIANARKETFGKTPDNACSTERAVALGGDNLEFDASPSTTNTSDDSNITPGSSFSPVAENLSELLNEDADYQCNFGAERLQKSMDLQFDRHQKQQNIEISARRKSLRQSAFATLLVFGAYVLFGCLFYSSWASDWPIRESIIFLIYTATTVGYGSHDIPTSPWSRAVTSVFVLVGVALMTVLVSELYQWAALEALQAHYRRHEAKLKMKLSEKYFGNAHTAPSEKGGSFSRKFERNVTATAKTWARETAAGQLTLVMGLLTVQCLFGAVIVGQIEGWDFISSFYWAVVTLSTVGYGDLHPTRSSSVWFTIFYLPLSIYFMSIYLSTVAKLYIHFHAVNISRIEDNLKENMKNEEKSIEETSGEDEAHSTARFEKMCDDSPEEVSDKFMSAKDIIYSIRSSCEEANIGSQKNLDNPKVVEGLVHNTKAKAKSRFSLKSNVGVFKNDEEKVNAAPFHVRMEIKEKLAKIIVEDVLLEGLSKKNIDLSISVSASKGNGEEWCNVDMTRSLSGVFFCMKQAEEKFQIAKMARTAFRSASLSVLFLCGESQIRSRGVDSLLSDIPSDQFNQLLNPVVACMGSPETVTAWVKWMNDTSKKGGVNHLDRAPAQSEEP